MGLPDQIELLKLFSAFLSEAGLSSVSIKNYLSDLRHFLSFCLLHPEIGQKNPTVKDIFGSLEKYLDHYLRFQKASFTPQNTINRRLASIRRFSTFLFVKFNLCNVFTDQNISNNIKKNKVFETNQTISPSSLNQTSTEKNLLTDNSSPSSKKILEQFKSSLEKEKKSHSTVKNYISDLNHFFLWTAKQTPFTDQNLVNILSRETLSAYITYLKLSHTSTSVLNRRQSSIKKLAKFCTDQDYLPENPFELKAPPKSLAPLAWIERLAKKKKQERPKGKLTVLYERYSTLPWTPYLNLALLVLATTAMAIFAYNQVISSARPSAAATALTPPKRQLSFQGRLTDSTGTPITTATNLAFRLYNALTNGTLLYNTGTCSITPDQDGIFNTLIGDGTCGAEISSSVFTDNRDIYMEVQVGSETLSPRQQIATVGFALNSETLQGYPASATATINTVPVVNNDGDINIAASSPSLISTSGTFSVEGQALTLKTTDNSGGNVVLQPDALGSGQILAIGGTTTEDVFRVTNANLTTGSLISGYVGNDTAAGRLISLTSGSTETDRFWVAADGRTGIFASATNSAMIVNQTGTGNLISASVSGTPKFTVDQSGNTTLASGADLIIGTIGLNDAGSSSITSGASLTGVYDEFDNSNSSTVQDVLDDLDAAITASSGDITAVGSMTSGAAFADATADDDWLGLGASAGRIEFDDQTTDEVNILDANVGIGTTGPDAKLDSLATTGEQLRLTYSDGSVYTGFTVDSNGDLAIDATGGDITLNSGDNLNLTAAGDLIFGGSTSLAETTAANDSGAYLVGVFDEFDNSSGANVQDVLDDLDTALTTALTSGGLWVENNGTLYPKNSTVDLLVGGQATASAKFAFLNVNSNTPTASISASSGNIATYLTGDGTLATTNRNSLTIGNSSTYNTTGNVLINSNGTGNVGIGTTGPSYTLDVTGDFNLTSTLRDNGDPGTAGQLLSSTATGIDWIDVSSVNYWQRNSGALAPLNLSDALNIGATATSSAYVHFAGTAGDDNFINNGNFGIGLVDPTYDLDLNGDFNIAGGGIRAGGSFGASGQVLTSTGTGVVWGDAATSSADLWATSNGALYPINATWDVLVGGSSTASAKFAFLNVNSNTPTASISASSGNIATYLTGDGTLATTNRNSLTIGNSSTYNTTGNVLINSNGTGNVGIGTTGPDRKLDILDASNPQLRLSQADGTVYSDFQITSSGDLIVNVDGVSNQLVLDDGGNIGIGTASPDAALGFSAVVGAKLNLYDGSNYDIGIQSSTFQMIIPSGDASSRFVFGKGTTDSLTELMRIQNDGNVGIGDTSPTALLTVGVDDRFQVNSAGAIASASGITSAGTITFTSLGAGIVHSNSSGVLSSSAVNLASSDVTGILPIANGGTNNNTYTNNELLIYDGTRIASSGFTTSSFESPLTFSNGLTRTVNTVTWGGQLTAGTSIDMNGNDVAFTGSGNFGVGVSNPASLFSVGTGSVFQVDTSGNTSIDNQGDLRLLEADANGSNYTGFQAPSSLGSNIIYTLPSSQGAANSTITNDGSGNFSWVNPSGSGVSGFWQRTAGADGNGSLTPTTIYDSINIGAVATSSALIHLSGSSVDTTSFFYNPVAFGFNTGLAGVTDTYVEVEGHVSPHSDATWNLGSASFQWQNLNLANGIFYSGTETIAINTSRLTGSIPWAALSGLRVGDGGSPVSNNALPTGISLYVNNGATISGTLGVVGESSLIGNVTVGGGTGKIDVGTVDPPYTINGQKYGTYMTAMIGVKEEVMGKINTSEYINGLGYRALIDLDGQSKGSDVWLFSKTTNIKNNLDQLSVLLTAEGQAKTWYDIDRQNKILAIYSSTPAKIIYRLTAPRFDAAKWSNTRTSESVGFVINDPDINENIPDTGFLTTVVRDPELIINADNSYSLLINGQENKEVASFFQTIIANLKVGTQIVTDLVADNLTIRTKLISPIADIDSLKVRDATVSGVLYADNIKGKTVDNLTAQLDLLDEKYATASAILADLQTKYTSYDALLGKISEASVSGDPLTLSPYATTSAAIPSDLALESINVYTIFSNDIMANGSVFAQAISSFDTDLYIQPTGDKPVHILGNLLALYPDGKVVASGDLLVTGTIYSVGLDTRTATVSGTLALGKGEIATDSGQLIALFDDQGQIVGSVDASGSANFGQLITGGLIIAAGNDSPSSSVSAQTSSNTTIGTAAIATGSSEITISNTKVTNNTLIYITPISDTDNQVLFVKSKQVGSGFTVAVPAQPNQIKQEISFNYWLVESK